MITVEEMIKQSVSNARLISWEHHVNDIDRLTDFYEDNQQAKPEYLSSYGFITKKGKLVLPLSTINLTKKVIDKISLIYKDPPIRLIDNEKNENVYNEWISQYAGFNLHLKEAERYKNLCDKILFRPVYYPMGKKWKFFIETLYRAHFSDEDALHPIGYSWVVKQDVTNTNIKSIRKEIWVYYSDEDYFYYDNHGEIWADPKFPDKKNPFSKMPFIEMRRNVAINEYDCQGALSLVDANRSINIAVNDLNVMIHNQAFSQKWAKGLNKEDAKEVQFDPWSVVSSQDSEFELNALDLNPKILESIEAIKFNLQAIAYSYNLNIDWSMDATPASGFSLLVKNIDLIEAREDDVFLARMHEQSIYDVIQMQQEYWKSELPKGGIKLPKDVKINVDFREFVLPVNRDEERADWDWKIKWNIRTPLDLIMIDNPDIKDEKEAEKIYMENKRINGNLTRQDRLRMAVEEELPKGVTVR